MSARRNVSFLVEPKEAVYFGPPRSFVAGESHHSRSMFPLPPTTFQGLIRSRLLDAIEPPLDLNDRSAEAARHLETLVGSPDALPEDWQITGPLLVESSMRIPTALGREEGAIPWVVAPRFLFPSRDGGPPLHGRLISSSHPAKNDLPTANWLVGRPEEGSLKPLEGWISCLNLPFALGGEGSGGWVESGYGKKEPPFVKWERHPGVAIDRGGGTLPVEDVPGSTSNGARKQGPGSTVEGEPGSRPDRGAAAAGMLYFLETLRFRPGSGLAGWFSGTVAGEIPDDALTTGIGVVGRHSRFVSFKPLPSPHKQWQAIMDGNHLAGAMKGKSQLFWLVAVTPAAVRTAVEPVINASLPAGVQILFHTALTGKPVPIGGYQVASGKSRPTRPYVPAGSCWLFELSGSSEEIRQRALMQLHGRHVLAPAVQAQFGYGFALVGIGPRISRR